MSDRLSRITKNIIRGGTAVAIGASAWACEKGYIVPDSVQTKTPITELVPPPTSTETISNEKISRYGQFEIGEVKIGVISDLKIQTNPDLNIVNKVKDLALLSIPEAKDKEISINIYDMIGDKGTAPFITASVNDSNGNLEFAYVGFSLDENNIQRPPIDGDIDIFYPLRVVEQEDKSVFIGIPDQTIQNLQTPIMFYVDQNNDTYFYPPYTDYLAQNDTTYGGMKVQAMLLKPESLLPQKYTQDEINQMTPAEILAKAPELEGYEKWRAAGKYAMYLNTQGQVEKAYDMTIGEYRDIPDYPVTTPENFRQNKISVDELLNGDYFLSLQKLAKQLECSPTMRTDVPLMPLGGLILYDQSSTPNFDVPGSEPFIRDYTSAYVEFPLTDGQVVDYAVMPLFMCDLNDNTKVYPIITVASAFHASMNQEKSNQIMFGGNGLFARWRKDMNITVIITSDKLTGARSGMQDPLVAQVFERYGEEEMKNRFDRYISGDFEALSAPDMVLLNLIATPKDGSGRILDVYK